MAQIGILRRLLLLIGHVDQKIEAVTIAVTVYNRQPLLFVELQKFPDGRAEVLQAPLVFRTPGGHPGLGSLDIFWRIPDLHRSTSRLRLFQEQLPGQKTTTKKYMLNQRGGVSHGSKEAVKRTVRAGDA
jgi:hypothetical protein